MRLCSTLQPCILRPTPYNFLPQPAGTDVYEGEPAEGAEIPFDNPLAQHHSVVATHHVGAATVQAQEAVALVLLDVINAYSTSNTIMNAVE